MDTVQFLQNEPPDHDDMIPRKFQHSHRQFQQQGQGLLCASFLPAFDCSALPGDHWTRKDSLIPKPALFFLKMIKDRSYETDREVKGKGEVSCCSHRYWNLMFIILIFNSCLKKLQKLMLILESYVKYSITLFSFFISKFISIPT